MVRDMLRHPPPAVDGHTAQPREAPTTAPGTRSHPYPHILLLPALHYPVLPVAKRAAAAWDTRLLAHRPARPRRPGSPHAPLAPLAVAARSPSLLPLQSRSRPASGSPLPRPPAFPAIKTINPASSAPRLPGAPHTTPHPSHARRQRCPLTDITTTTPIPTLPASLPAPTFPITCGCHNPSGSPGASSALGLS